MALPPGVIDVTLEFGQHLKDVDWFGREDPYARVRVGSQQYRTRTATNAGRNPVWNETFRFDIINESDAEVEIKDDNVIMRDGHIGGCWISFATVRMRGADRLTVPIMCRHSGRQHGAITVSLRFTPTGSYSAAPSAPPLVPGYPAYASSAWPAYAPPPPPPPPPPVYFVAPPPPRPPSPPPFAPLASYLCPQPVVVVEFEAPHHHHHHHGHHHHGHHHHHHHCVW